MRTFFKAVAVFAALAGGAKVAWSESPRRGTEAKFTSMDATDAQPARSETVEQTAARQPVDQGAAQGYAQEAPGQGYGAMMTYPGQAPGQGQAAYAVLAYPGGGQLASYAQGGDSYADEGYVDEGYADYGNQGVPFWAHRTGAFGEFLYLQARGVDMAYGQPRDGVDPIRSVPAGAVGVANPDYSPGFRAGFGVAVNNCASVVGSFTWFASTTFDQITINPPNVIHSLVTHPATLTAASDSLVANANYDIDFRLADVAYRRLITGGTNHAINYEVGLRYARLQEDFTGRQPISPTITTVTSLIGFEGLGPRFGLLAERKAPCVGFMVYGRTYASFIAGHFDSRYLQQNSLALTQAFTSWKDDRVVPILEYELGAGWQNQRGTVRLTAGYYMAAWFNSVTTNNFIQAVQRSNYVSVNDTITFDGLVARFELRR